MLQMIIRALAVTLLMLSMASTWTYAQAKTRNLKEYAFRQTFDIDNYLTLEEANARRTAPRSLIWQWWTNQIKGHFKAIFYTIEGKAIWCNYFVEPDARGKWQVVIESKYSVCPYSSRGKCRKYFRTPSIASFDTIERIEPGFNKFSPSPPKLPDNEKRHPGKFVLLLKNSKNNALHEL